MLYKRQDVLTASHFVIEWCFYGIWQEFASTRIWHIEKNYTRYATSVSLNVNVTRFILRSHRLINITTTLLL